MKRNHVVALGIVVAIFVAGVAALSDSGSEPEAPPGALQATPRAPAGEAKEIYTFDSLAQMLATSDVVILGEVSGIRDGEIIGYDPTEDESAAADAPPGEDTVEAAGGLRTYDVDVDVVEIVSGEPHRFAEASETRITLTEDLVLVAPWEVGQEGVLFLEEKPGTGRLRSISSTARFLIADDGVGVEPSGDSEAFRWIEPLEAMTFEDFLSKVRATAATVKDEPVSGVPDPREE